MKDLEILKAELNTAKMMELVAHADWQSRAREVMDIQKQIKSIKMNLFVGDDIMFRGKKAQITGFTRFGHHLATFYNTDGKLGKREATIYQFDKFEKLNS